MRPFIVCLALVMMQVDAVEWHVALERVTVGDPPLSAAQSERALVVSSISRGSVAERAGLQKGDRLLELDGWRVHDKAEYTLVRWFASSLTAPMRLIIQREGATLALDFRPDRPRTAGFAFDDPVDVLPAALLRRGWIPDARTDPWTWRSWRQFPGRWAAVILETASAEDGDPPPWFPALSALWCHLCQQDFAAAAQIAMPAPPESLQRPIAFWQALAAYHAEGEQDPDPAACGVDRLAFILWYPWPLVTGPAPGERLGAELAGMMEDLRQLPALLRPDREQWVNRALAQFSTGHQVFQGHTGSYLQMYWAAAIDPDTHGGWPYRHRSVWQQELRATVIAELEARLGDAEDPHAMWIQAGYWMAKLVEAMRERNNRSPFLAAWEQHHATFRSVAEGSPWLAWRMLGFLPHAVHPQMHRVRSVRHIIRALVDDSALAITPVPSRFLAWCHARDPGVGFALGDAQSGTSGSDPLSAWRALAAPSTLADLQAALAAVPSDAGPEVREPLLDAWVALFHGRAQGHDVRSMLRPFFASGQASGLLMDRLPDLMLWQWAEREDDDFLEPLRQALLPRERAYDLDALQRALATVRWDDDPAPAIAAIRRAFGNPYGALVIADACVAQGRLDLAEPMRHQVQDVLQAYGRYLRVRGFARRDQAVSYGWSSLVFSSSLATAAAAIPAGDRHIDLRGERPWESVYLAIAQAHLLLNQDGQAIEALIRSTSGESFDHVFVGPYGSVRNAPALRTWLLGELAQRGRLDEPTRRRIADTGRPGSFDAAGLERLGVVESQLGPQAVELNDF